MSRILLADDSPHAQRMGERLLRDEGHEVVTITDGDTVFVRLPDVDPDVLILDANLPLRNGYEIARFVKNSAFYRHAGVVLTGSAAEPVDEALARSAGAEAVLLKPFEARALLGLVGPMAARAEELRELRPAGPPPPPPGEEPAFVSGAVPAEPEPEFGIDPEADPPLVQLAPAGVKVVAESEPEPEPEPVSEAERVRAAVTLALDAAMPQLIEELTQQTLRALHSR
jgi:CheY-like chemotaxis protein